ncbi:MAG: type II 3-dehydroquinate dehydratase [Albidovulum sp.]|nr:type II 3-dehydroquinate dehydratase [Albidovulum sp.]MDE0532328.1 type II 3-dehydroquinate dehydratase [Albidovulum sp.]
MTSILVLNGPNLNMLGSREPEIYGTDSLTAIERICRERGDHLGVDIEFLHSNHEGTLIDAIHNASTRTDAIVINAAAYTHTSVALMDALKSVPQPVVEIHLTNIHRRESFRSRSYISLAADGVILGFGAKGYALAIEAALGLAKPR